MKCQALFSLKNKKNKKLSSAAVVIGALKVTSNRFVVSLLLVMSSWVGDGHGPELFATDSSSSHQDL